MYASIQISFLSHVEIYLFIHFNFFANHREYSWWYNMLHRLERKNIFSEREINT